MALSIENHCMKDVQSSNDTRHVYINKVGIRNVNYPLIIKSANYKPQHATVKVGMFVFLPDDKKGTHMSRFIEVLDKYKEIDFTYPREILAEIKNRLDTDEAFIELEFSYFMDKYAPKTSKHSIMDYGICVSSKIDKLDNINTRLSIEVPVTTLCPCSKEISDYGAHSQIGVVTLHLEYQDSIDIHKIISMVEDSASCPLYPILKREDEKFVTEEAYRNPVFVEDLVREVTLKMETLDNLTYLKCEVENYESIHKHNAYAMVERYYS